MVAWLMARPEASGEEREVLEGIKMMLNGREVQEVERDLAAGVVRKSHAG